MHKLNSNTDKDSIDFDFFEVEGDRIKMYENHSNNSSKIITKAVIEAKPIEMPKTKQTSKFDEKVLKLKSKTEVGLIKNELNDILSSPTSSEEKRLLSTPTEDVTLFNCLAFNESNKEKQIFNFMDDKYFSDNSLSDSTVTTVTSDFTTVSHLSSISDSSCESDLSVDSPVPQNDDSITNHVEELNSSIPDSDLNECHLNVISESSSLENMLNDIDNSSEISDSENKARSNKSDEENKEITNTEDQNIIISSNKTEISDNTIEIELRNTYSKIENSKDNCKHSSLHSSLSRKESISSLEEGLGDISLGSNSISTSSIAKHHSCRGQNKFRTKRREFNLTFSREELIKIERDNTILLKKIMAYSKPRSVSLNHAFSHKKTSAAINRARQQKKIDQDNYILYSKISTMSRMKKVF